MFIESPVVAKRLGTLTLECPIFFSVTIVLKKPLDESEGGEWKSWPKAQHSETKLMASGPITSWEIDGETVADFIFLGSKIPADGDCSHEIKRHLLLGKKVMTNLDSILKAETLLCQQRSV